jgi:cell division septation protein DedD
MAFDIGELTAKLKEIETYAMKVAETKRLADQLAENLAKMKTAINQTINDSFTEIANQIDTLRKNMEEMESVKAPGGAAAAPAAAPTPTPEPAPVAAPSPAPESAHAAAPEPAPEPVAEAVPAEGSDQLDFLLQQKDRLKASLTDLRFDYMRGYIPEDDYKSKETELDSQLEEIDRQIAGLK